MKKFLRILLALLVLVIAAGLGYFFIDFGGKEQKLLSFVPADFVYAIETDRPVGDWQDLSESKPWQFLKNSEFFAEISEMADYLDSVLLENETWFNLFEIGSLMVSAHMVSRSDYEFIFLVDLKGKGRKLTKLRPLVRQFLEGVDYEVSVDDYIGNDLYRLYDPVEKSSLFMAIVDNVLAIAYVEDLVKKAVLQSGQESLALQPDFAKVSAERDLDELYTLYLNYAELERLIGTYTQEIPENLQGLGEILSYSAWDLSIADEEVTLEGHVKQIDSAASYLNVFQDVGKGRVMVSKVLPQNTATFTSIGFDNFADFYSRFEEHYASTDSVAFAEFDKKKRRWLEGWLKVDLQRDFFQWMTDEIATAIVPVPSAGGAFSYYALIHFDDYDQTLERLEYVNKRIKKRSPVKFKEKDYRGYNIRYLEMKGFFKLFFRKLFDRIEKPHYAFIDDYVVFTNDTTSMQYLIDSYLNQQVLGSRPYYQEFRDHFSNTSNVFTYLQNAYLYDYLMTLLEPESRQGLRKNRLYLQSFPQVGLQLFPASGMYKTFLFGEFVHPEALP